MTKEEKNIEEAANCQEKVLNGDTCFDADAGFLIYEKGEWVSNNQKYADLYDKTHKT